MNYVTACLKAALTGGVIAVVVQLLLMLFSSCGLDPLFVGCATILVSGLAGSVLMCLGVYPAIEKFGGFGSILPLFGLGAAFTGLYAQIRGGGATAGQALAGAWGFFFKFLTVGLVLSVLAGVIPAFL
ncbi:MAG: SpoVA/SpoVAEb family sporulation membrane protein [Duodenibacillus sp.]|nr:SpoVA/SpoVAEb family sporulation membrane protein [Duodenibacillus sp.]